MASANPNDEDYDPSLVNTAEELPLPQPGIWDGPKQPPGPSKPGYIWAHGPNNTWIQVAFGNPNASTSTPSAPPPAAKAPPPADTGTKPPAAPTGTILPKGSIGTLLDSYPGGDPPPYVNPSTTLPTQPGYTPPPAFQAPTGDEVRGTPGYQFGLDEGKRAVEASAAAKGTLNTGGTLEDVLKYGQGYADQQYQTSLNNAMNIYGVNYGTQYLDPYNFQMKGYQNAVDANISGATGQNLYNQNTWLDKYNAWRNHNNDTYNYLYGLTSLGPSVQ